jgi:hypothetical protein
MHRILHIMIVIGLTMLFVLAVLTAGGPEPKVAEQHSDVRLL